MTRIKLLEIFHEAVVDENPPEGPLLSTKTEDLSAKLSVRNKKMNNNQDHALSVPSSTNDFPCLESLPTNRVFKYHLPREQREGKWYRTHYRITFKESIKGLKKKLLWKTIFSTITVAEFLVLDHCIQQSWRESKLAGNLDFEILILESLMKEQRVSSKRWDQSLSKFRPSARLNSLCGSTETSDEEESKQQLKRILKLPDKVSSEPIIDFKKVKTVSPTPPPKPVIGVGYKDHGSRKEDHELGFEIVSGMQDTETFDSVVLQILKQT